MGEQPGGSGIGYLIEALDRQADLPRKAEYVALMRRELVDEADRSRALTPQEETAIGVVLGAVQLAIAENDYEGLMRAVAAGVQLGMRFAGGAPDG